MSHSYDAAQQWHAELTDPALTTKTLLRAFPFCEQLLRNGEWALAIDVADTALAQARGRDVRLNLRLVRVLAQLDGTGVSEDADDVVRALLERADELYATALTPATTADGAPAVPDPSLGNGAAQRLSQALVVLLHRARHTSEGVTPLATDPAGFLSVLRGSRLYRDLQPASPRVRRQRGRRGSRSLLLLTSRGSFFSAPVVEAAELAGLAVTEEVLADLEPQWRGMTALLAERTARLVRPADSSANALAPPDALVASDVCFVEWADEAAAWASVRLPRRRLLRRAPRLVVRLHSVEVLSVALHVIDWSRVDLVVFVSPALQWLAAAVQPALASVPSLVVSHGVEPMDVPPKLPEATTTLGMVGWGQVVKDPVFALRVLRGLRAEQPEREWRLRLIGASLAEGVRQWEADYLSEFERLMDDEGLRAAVVITPHTDDVEAALADVGWILSTSLREADPHGVLEGVLCGAVPVVRDWPVVSPWGGARSLIPANWVVASEAAAVERILGVPDREHAALEAREWLLTNRPDRAARAQLARALRPGSVPRKQTRP